MSESEGEDMPDLVSSDDSSDSDSSDESEADFGAAGPYAAAAAAAVPAPEPEARPPEPEGGTFRSTIEEWKIRGNTAYKRGIQTLSPV